MASPSDLLNQARVAKRDGLSSQAIEALVLAWQGCREPWLADLIDRWIVSVAVERPPIGTRQQGWLERAAERQSADLPHLIEAIARASSSTCLERIQALGEWGPHPFIARVLAQWALENPFGKNARAALAAAFPVLARIEDPRVAAVLARASSMAEGELHHGRKNWLALQALAKVAAQWSVVAAVPPTNGAELEPEPSARRDHSPLFEAVHAAPDDLDRRQVLADALLEDGDARGEFLAIQIERARRNSTRIGAREKELLTQYGPTWLGPLAPHFKSTRFERGFLIGGELNAVELTPQARADRAWALVEWLDTSRAGASMLELTRMCPRLRALTGTDIGRFLEARMPTPLALVELGGAVDLEWDLEPLSAAGAVFPRLEILSLMPRWRSELRPQHVAQLYVSPFGRQLNRLKVHLKLVETYEEGVAVHDLVAAVLASGRGHFELEFEELHLSVDVEARQAHLHCESPPPRPFFLPHFRSVQLSGVETAISPMRTRLDAESVTIASGRHRNT